MFENVLMIRDQRYKLTSWRLVPVVGHDKLASPPRDQSQVFFKRESWGPIKRGVAGVYTIQETI